MPNTIQICLAAFLALVPASPAESQQPPPAPPKGVQQPKGDTSKQDGRPDPVQHTAPSVAPSSIPPTAPTNQPEAATRTEHQENYASPEWGLVYVTVVLAVVTALLARYTAKLWGATKELAVEAKTTADRQALDVQASLDLARESADIAAQAAKAATLHAMAAVAVERAFVRVHDLAVGYPDNPTGDSQPLKLHFSFRNFGRTPGFLTRIRYGFQVANDPTAPEPEYPFSDNLAPEFVIEPQATRWLDAPGRIVMPSTDWTAVNERTAIMWCWGVLQYRDFMNGVAETGFVARYFPDVGTAGHVEENARFDFVGPASYTYQRYTEGESQ